MEKQQGHTARLPEAAGLERARAAGLEHISSSVTVLKTLLSILKMADYSGTQSCPVSSH